MFTFGAAMASGGSSMRTNGDQKLNNANEAELIQMESDSLNQDQSPKQEAQPEAKPKKEDATEEEEESVSILSVNIIFEIISNFNLRDLLLPSRR